MSSPSSASFAIAVTTLFIFDLRWTRTTAHSPWRHCPGFGYQPWFITDVPGEIYIKRKWQDRPFIRKVYLPNSLLGGPRHKVVSVLTPWEVADTEAYAQREVSDEEFCRLRRAATGR